MLKISASEKHTEIQNTSRIWVTGNLCVTACIVLKSSLGNEPCVSLAAREEEGLERTSRLLSRKTRGSLHHLDFKESPKQVELKKDAAISDDLFHVWILIVAVTFDVE